MASASRDELVGAMALLLKPLGFKKLRSTWYRASEETIQTINVQASLWGPEYYVNVGTYLRALGDETTPPEYRCHIRSRIHPSDRSAEALVRDCSAWFEQFGSVGCLVAHSRNGSLPLTTNGKAREWLNAA